MENIKATDIYADRTTEFFSVGPKGEPSFEVVEVTVEPGRGQEDGPNFWTIAWCPNAEAAGIVARALRAYVLAGGKL